MLTKIQTKIILFLGGTVAFIMVIAFLFREAEMQRLDQLKQERKTGDSLIVATLMEAVIEKPKLFAYDYSYWDETITYTYNPSDTEWVNYNIVSTISKFSIKNVWFFDSTLTLRSSATKDAGVMAEPFPIPTEEIARLIAKEKFPSFFWIGEKRLTQYFGAPLQPTADTSRATKHQGYMFVSFEWEGPVITKLEKAARVRLFFLPVENALSLAEDTYSINNLFFLQNHREQTVLALVAQSISELYISAQKNLETQFNALLIFLSFLVASTAAFIIINLGKPLSTVIRSLSGKNTALLEPLRKGKNEFAQIAQLIEDSFKHSEKLEGEVESRKRIEAALRESEERFRGIYENASVGIYRTSISGTLLFANRAFYMLLGYDKEAIPKPGEFNPLLHYPEKERQRFFQAILREGELQGFESNVFTRSGETIVISEYARLIRDEQNQPVYIDGVLDDITRKKEYERELINAREKAEEADRVKTGLMENLSHEFRTPMNGILGYGELMLEEAEDPQIKHYAEKILVSSKRLMSTLNNVLDISQLQSTVPVVFEPVNLTEVIKLSISHFTHSAAAKNLKLESRVPENEILIASNYEMIRKILNHLVDNAIKYTFEGRVLIEALSPQPDVIAILVTDTGIGIAPEKQDMIFQEFRQASEGIGRYFEGAGLGLSIAKKMARLLHGDISVTSIPGKGSTFTFTLPLNRPDGKKKAPLHDVVKHTPTVLVVEDNEINREIMIRYLAGVCRVDNAEDAQTAISMCRKKHYDIIFMDINLGEGIDGVDAMQTIRQDAAYSRTPFVAVTGFALSGDRDALLAKGMDYYLAKPFEREELHNLVQQIMKK